MNADARRLKQPSAECPLPRLLRPLPSPQPPVPCPEPLSPSPWPTIKIMTDGALLNHITRLPHSKANFKQLVRELGTKGVTRADLELALRFLRSGIRASWIAS